MKSIKISSLAQELALRLDIPKQHTANVLSTYTKYVLGKLEEESEKNIDFLGIINLEITKKENREQLPLRYVAGIISDDVLLPSSLVYTILNQTRTIIVEKLLEGEKIVLTHIGQLVISNKTKRVSVLTSRRFYEKNIPCSAKATIFLKSWVEQEQLAFGR